MKTVHLSQNDVAERWKISPRTLERWRWEGVGPLHLKIGGRILYRIEDILVYEQGALRQETTKDAGVDLEQAA
ncbi:MAG: helix-turn-helix domain-containing protein [Bdellovibrionales bacterium]